MKSTPFLMFLAPLLIIATSVQAANVEVQDVPAESRASKLWQSAEPSKVKIGGEMGRRIDITIDSHLLKLDFEKLYFVDYRAKKHSSGFIGLGMLIDAVVGFADYRRDEKMINLKNYLIVETLKTQTEDGYIGTMRPDSRIIKEWDIHSAGHLVIGLVAPPKLPLFASPAPLSTRQFTPVTSIQQSHEISGLNQELNQKALGNRDIKDIVIDITSVIGPVPDASTRPDGLACTVKAWSKDLNYPMSLTDMTLTLTEVADPGSSRTYLKLASPEQPGHEDDELFGVKSE